ncbi:MAG: aminotransferase class I/II-fold pyridoxal phosphate-dependent enzyme, partial [Myxococcota bacterium]
MDIAETVVEVLRRALKPTGFVPLHEPQFEGEEWTYLKDCLDSGWVSSVGKYVDRFEAALCELTGAKRAVAVANGTAGLHVALIACGIDRDDEVLVPSITFAATAAAICHAGAIPHFVDSEPDTLGIDPIALEAHLESVADRTDQGCVNRVTGRPIVALVPVHIF